MENSASYSSSEAEPLSLKAEKLWFGSFAALPREITVWLLRVFTSFWGPGFRWTQTLMTPQFLLITTKKTKLFLKESLSSVAPAITEMRRMSSLKGNASQTLPELFCKVISQDPLSHGMRCFCWKASRQAGETQLSSPCCFISYTQSKGNLCPLSRLSLALTGINLPAEPSPSQRHICQLQPPCRKHN